MNKKISAFILSAIIAVSFASSIFAGFTDVPDNHPDKSYIDFCEKNGFIKGYGEGLFRPDGTITRGEFITIWARTFHARQHTFDDATKTKDELDTAIVLMYGLGYVNGVSKTQFSINDNITREEVAKIVENTYLPGIDGDEEYTNYSDHEDISSWAKNAVSVCYQKGIFEGVASDKFEPQKAITRSEVCAVITKFMKMDNTMYDITIGDLTDGTITADKTKAAAGDTVTLTVTPDDEKMLNPGSLKYNNVAITGTSFIMPAADVTITGEFIVYLKSIAVEAPTKLIYAVGEELDLKGMTVTAIYSDGSDSEVTGYTTNPVAGTELEEQEGSEVEVVVSYTENSVTLSDTFTVHFAGPMP